MTLAFMTTFPAKLDTIGGKPTFFPEKIWASLFKCGVAMRLTEFVAKGNVLAKDFSDSIMHFNAKRHSIRVDQANRWQVGKMIHFVINNRRPGRLHFAPLVSVTGVQTIVIENMFLDRRVYVDGRMLEASEIDELAINDGFDNSTDFFAYFGMDDFTGKLIHWTDLKY